MKGIRKNLKQNELIIDPRNKQSNLSVHYTGW